MLTRPDLSRIRARLNRHIHETPLWHSRTMSRLSGFNVYLKAELLQKTGSYKPRGMLWAVMSLSDQQRARGVITFSAGNAAQGLAYAGGLLGVKVIVTMPEAASPTKAQAAREYGAEVILHGTARECLERCREIAADRGLTFVSAYDDISLMQGHATLGMEVLEQCPGAQAIVLGVGGGGMLGGMALALEACSSAATLIGVEPEGAPAMYRSFESGRAVTLESVNTIADGLAAPGAGIQCFEVARKRTEKIVLVSDAEIVTAMKLLMERCKLFAEPAGAAALAGVMSGRLGLLPDSNVVVVISGGNLDLQRLKNLL